MCYTSSMLLTLPKRLNYGPQFQQTLNNLESIRNEPKVTINLADLEFARPVASLVIGAKLRDVLKQRNRNNYKTYLEGFRKNSPAQSYLMHMGFFDYCGFENIGHSVGEATGTTSFMPITCIEKETLLALTQAPYRKLRDVILDESQKLAAILVDPNQSPDAYWSIAYSIREVIRNVFEHAQATHCYVCGQRWSNGQVQLGIIDSGIGIRHSIKSTVPILDDCDALNKVVLPGLSRSNNKVKNVFDNSGYGLYVLSEIGREYGRFTLGSGKACLRISKRGEVNDHFRFTGTVVGLHFDKTPNNFEHFLQETIYSGEQEARLLGYNEKASESSRRFI